MGCIKSCLSSEKSFKSSFDGTFDPNSQFLNRMSMVTQNRNVTDVKDGLPRLISNRYRIDGDALHCGGFGCIYGATDLNEEENSKEIGKAISQSKYKYAAKVEDLTNNYEPQLNHEHKMYVLLNGGKGIPRMYEYVDGPSFGILVMDMLGPSLQQCYRNCNRVLSLKTVLMLAEQMIDRVQYMHEHNFVHRDLKPDNFAIGRPGSADSRTLFILDFGLAKRWRNYLTKEKRPFIKRYAGLVGTMFFAARSAHEGWEQGRKDDLESLGYIFLYLLNRLPWMQSTLQNLDTEEYDKICEDMKCNLRLKEYGKDIPKEFIQYLEYTRNLGYLEKPDYDGLKKLLRSRARKLGIRFPYENDFDWEVVSNHR